MKEFCPINFLDSLLYSFYLLTLITFKLTLRFNHVKSEAGRQEVGPITKL